jgi:hypothetical protein
MSSRKITNISLPQYRKFLLKAGCRLIRVTDGHEVWTKKDLTRPIVFKTHIDAVPEFIINNALRALGYSKSKFWETLER